MLRPDGPPVNVVLVVVVVVVVVLGAILPAEWLYLGKVK